MSQHTLSFPVVGHSPTPAAVAPTAPYYTKTLVGADSQKW